MPLVGGLDFGGGAVKASIADVESGAVLAVTQEGTTTDRPGADRAEFDPGEWWAAATAAMRRAVALAGRPGAEYAAASVTSLRQGYLLIGRDGAVLGPGVLNSDRRGRTQLDRLRSVVGTERLYALTGHWPAPELTLPKLLAEQAADPRRWAGVERVLFLHDWALWRLCGEMVSEPSVASAGQLLDVRGRRWATDLLAELGLPLELLSPLVDAGTLVGRLRDDTLGLPPGLPVLAGGGDTQLAACGAGGLGQGVVSVVAGTTTPVQASTDSMGTDPLRHPWVSCHLLPGWWAAETNAGYAGMSLDWLARISGRSVGELAAEAAGSAPGARGMTALVASATWSEATWSERIPNVLIGFDPRHGIGDVARAFIEAHAYAIRSNVEDLERATGSRASEVLLLGGAGRDRAFAQLVSDVLDRPLRQGQGAYPPGAGFAWLARRSESASMEPPIPEGETIEPRRGHDHQEGYRRFIAADHVIRHGLEVPA